MNKNMKTGAKINEASANQIKAGATGTFRKTIVLKKTDCEKLAIIAEKEQLTESDLYRRAIKAWLRNYEQTGQI